MNLCNQWDAAQYPYIRFSPDASTDESNRAWQECPTIAVTNGGRIFAVDCAPDGTIFIVYDRERDNRIGLNRETWMSTAAKEILLCRLTTDDIIRGQLSESSFVRRVISRGETHFVER